MPLDSSADLLPEFATSHISFSISCLATEILFSFSVGHPVPMGVLHMRKTTGIVYLFSISNTCSATPLSPHSTTRQPLYATLYYTTSSQGETVGNRACTAIRRTNYMNTETRQSYTVIYSTTFMSLHLLPVSSFSSSQRSKLASV